MIAYAAAVTTLNNQSTLMSVVSFFIGIIGLILPVLISLAILAFLFGLVKFILASGDEKSHAQGRSFMIWSVIALFVLVSFMGIISFFYNDFGFTSNPHPFGIPALPVDGTLPTK